MGETIVIRVVFPIQIFFIFPYTIILRKAFRLSLIV